MATKIKKLALQSNATSSFFIICHIVKFGDINKASARLASIPIILR